MFNESLVPSSCIGYRTPISTPVSHAPYQFERIAYKCFPYAQRGPIIVRVQHQFVELKTDPLITVGPVLNITSAR